MGTSTNQPTGSVPSHPPGSPTPPPDQSLADIRQQLDRVEKKIADKWFLPIVITVLTFLLTLVNYFVTRHYNLQDIAGNKGKEVVGAYLTNTKIEFYNSCKTYLTTLLDRFDSYCNIGPVDAEKDSIATILGRLNRSIEIQQVMDQKVIAPLNTYRDYLADALVDIDNQQPDKPKLRQIFQGSAPLFSEAVSVLDKGIQELIQQQ